MPTKKRIPWTADEDQLLLSLRAAGVSQRLMALKLERTEAAVNSRLVILLHRDRPEEARGP